MMVRFYRIPAKVLILACFFVFAEAHAEPGLLDRVGSIFDNIGQGLSLVGKKASDLLGPGLGLGERDWAEFAHTRQFNERYPVGPAPLVSVSSEFGEIRVVTWPNPVVEVVADIRVGADSVAVATEIAEAIEIQVTPGEDLIEVRTRLPDIRKETGKETVVVNYTLTIPDDSGLIVNNYFGDTLVRDIGGTLGIQAQYGLVDIRNVAGPVRVKQRGAFAFEARGLEQGGSFQLNGAHALFSDVAGTLKISNFGGAVELRDLAPDAELDVSNESGTIFLDLPEGAAPDLVATSLFGEIKSSIELGWSSQGDFTVARSPNVESGQHISLRTSFGDIHITSGADLEMDAGPALVEGTLPFSDVVAHAEPVAEGTPCVVEAIVGDVRIEGVDRDEIRVTATKFVRVRDKEATSAALEALVFEVQKEEGRFVVRTRVIDDMGALGCPAYRVDLAIECPRTCPLVVHAAEGHTDVKGTGASVHVEQGAGAITVEHAKGPQELSNQKGDVSVMQSAGPITVSARYGSIRLTGIYGDVQATCEQGKTVIESLHAGVSVHNSGGDVRIIALEGIKGEYDIEVEQGNLSIVLPADADAGFDVAAENGTVFSGIPLDGTISRGVQEFHRRLSDGSHRVSLRAKDGDIRIN